MREPPIIAILHDVACWACMSRNMTPVLGVIGSLLAWDSEWAIWGLKFCVLSFAIQLAATFARWEAIRCLSNKYGPLEPQ